LKLPVVRQEVVRLVVAREDAKERVEQLVQDVPWTWVTTGVISHPKSFFAMV
jgi:hypothetical protein